MNRGRSAAATPAMSGSVVTRRSAIGEQYVTRIMVATGACMSPCRTGSPCRREDTCGDDVVIEAGHALTGQGTADMSPDHVEVPVDPPDGRIVDPQALLGSPVEIGRFRPGAAAVGARAKRQYPPRTAVPARREIDLGVLDEHERVAAGHAGEHRRGDRIGHGRLHGQ